MQNFHRLSILVCHVDEISALRISKLLSDFCDTQRCDSVDDILDKLTANHFNVIIFGVSDNKNEVIDAIKLHRFMHAEDRDTKFYLYSLNGECNSAEMDVDIHNAQIDGVITTLSVMIDLFRPLTKTNRPKNQ